MKRSAAREWGLAAALAGAIVAGPLVTLAGAGMLAKRIDAETGAVVAEAAPLLARVRDAQADRARLSALAGRPTAGQTLDALARALPADSALVRVSRRPGRGLEAEIATPDPDRLRAALRREPLLAALRNTGQRQGEGAMVVALREGAP